MLQIERFALDTVRQLAPVVAVVGSNIQDALGGTERYCDSLGRCGAPLLRCFSTSPKLSRRSMGTLDSACARHSAPRERLAWHSSSPSLGASPSATTRFSLHSIASTQRSTSSRADSSAGLRGHRGARALTSRARRFGGLGPTLAARNFAAWGFSPRRACARESDEHGRLRGELRSGIRIRIPDAHSGSRSRSGGARFPSGSWCWCWSRSGSGCRSGSGSGCRSGSGSGCRSGSGSGCRSGSGSGSWCRSGSGSGSWCRSGSGSGDFPQGELSHVPRTHLGLPYAPHVGHDGASTSMHPARVYASSFALTPAANDLCTVAPQTPSSPQLAFTAAQSASTVHPPRCAAMKSSCAFTSARHSARDGRFAGALDGAALAVVDPSAPGVLDAGTLAPESATAAVLAVSAAASTTPPLPPASAAGFVHCRSATAANGASATTASALPDATLTSSSSTAASPPCAPASARSCSPPR